MRKIWEEVLPYNHPDLAKIYNNIGNLFNFNGKNEETLILSYFFKCQIILEKNILSNHSNLAAIYSDIAAYFYGEANAKNHWAISLNACILERNSPL